MTCCVPTSEKGWKERKSTILHPTCPFRPYIDHTTNGKFIRLFSLFVTSCDAYHLQSLHQHIQQGTLLAPQGMRAGLYTVVDLIRTEAHSLRDKNIASVVSKCVKLSAALGEQLPFHPRQCLSSQKTGFLRVDTSPFPLGTSSQANKRKWKKCHPAHEVSKPPVSCGLRSLQTKGLCFLNAPLRFFFALRQNEAQSSWTNQN